MGGPGTISHGHRGTLVKFLDNPKLYVDFQLCGRSEPLILLSFKGQLYLDRGLLWKCISLNCDLTLHPVGSIMSDSFSGIARSV